MKKIVLLLGIFLVGAMFFACAPKSVPGEKPISPEPLTGKEAWEAEWEKTLEAAKKEGKVIAYAFAVPGPMAAMSKGFKNRTGLDIEFVAGRGAEITSRLFTERRAGLYYSDVFVTGSNSTVGTLKPSGVLAPLKPQLFLPEVLDPEVWFQKKLPWVDREEKYVLAFLAYPAGAKEIAFNTNLIKKDEVNSFRKLLHPKFKGVMNMQDPTSAGKGLKWFQAALKVYPALDIDFMKALARQEPLITRDQRLQVEWIAKGKHLVSILPENTLVSDFITAGAPIAYLSPEEVRPRIATGGGSLVLVKDAPHPNAAKLFINWLLSKEGQTAYSQAYPGQSAREDISTDFLPPDEVRQLGLNYFVEDEEFLLGADEAAKVSKEIFGHLLR